MSPNAQWLHQWCSNHIENVHLSTWDLSLRTPHRSFPVFQILVYCKSVSIVMFCAINTLFDNDEQALGKNENIRIQLLIYMSLITLSSLSLIAECLDKMWQAASCREWQMIKDGMLEEREISKRESLGKLKVEEIIEVIK